MIFALHSEYAYSWSFIRDKPQITIWVKQCYTQVLRTIRSLTNSYPHWLTTCTDTGILAQMSPGTSYCWEEGGRHRHLCVIEHQLSKDAGPLPNSDKLQILSKIVLFIKIIIQGRAGTARKDHSIHDFRNIPIFLPTCAWMVALLDLEIPPSLQPKVV